MNVFELFGTIAINNKGANKSIDETGSKAKSLANAFGKIGNEALKVGKTVAKGMSVIGAAGAAAVSLLLKNSIGNYAEYEQLVGGVETLFKDSQDKVLKYAKNAYKTAGLSANDYMSTVTSFSASLLKGLGGDTAAAAEMANMAVTDMADNANKMGTDISMIQNAYQGFAKQNYTMLDNLKLGYGGTATEMARLINDSGVMGETMVVTAENLNEVSFAKMIEAIHVIQKEMGIAGATAEEAEKTITGSFNAWKAAGSNLLVSMASGDEKTRAEATAAFTETTKTLLTNVKPVMLNAINSIGTVLTEILPDILSLAGDCGAAIFAEILNGLTGSDVSAEDVKAAAQTMIDAVVGAWETATTTVTNAVAAVDKFFNVTIPETWNAMVQGVKEAWTDTVAPAIDSAAIAVADFFGIPVPENWSLSTQITEKWNEIISKIQEAIDKVREFLGLNKDPEEEKYHIYNEPIGPLTVQQQQHESAGRYAHWTDAQKDAAFDYISAVRGGYRTTDEVLQLQSVGLTDEAIANFQADISELLASGEFTVEIEDAMFEPGTQANLQSQLNSMPLVARITTKVQSIKDGLFDWAYSALGVTPDGSHASGLNYVPKDNYLANLHLGEAVLPRNEAELWRSGKGEGSVDTSKLESIMGTVATLLQQVAANTAGGQNVVLDTGVLVGQMAPRLDAQLGIMTARKERRG